MSHTVETPFGTFPLGEPALRAALFAWDHYVAGHRYFVLPSTVVCDCGESVAEPTVGLAGPTGRFGIAFEASCTRCGESFSPSSAEDLVHLRREDGAECGGDGYLRGRWGLL